MKYLNEVHGNKQCPACGVGLEKDDIYEHFLSLGKTPAEALESAQLFGWSTETPKKFGRVIGIETEQYDGVTWWLCPDCGVAWKRFEWSEEKYIEHMEFPVGMRGE